MLFRLDWNNAHVSTYTITFVYNIKPVHMLYSFSHVSLASIEEKIVFPVQLMLGCPTGSQV